MERSEETDAELDVRPTSDGALRTELCHEVRGYKDCVHRCTSKQARTRGVFRPNMRGAKEGQKRGRTLLRVLVMTARASRRAERAGVEFHRKLPPHVRFANSMRTSMHATTTSC